MAPWITLTSPEAGRLWRRVCSPIQNRPSDLKLRAAGDSEEATLRLVGSAYGALDNLDVAGGWATLEAGLQSNPESPLLNRVRETFEKRMRVTADEALSSALERARAALAAGDPRSAVDVIRSVSALTGHARLELQGERQRLLKEALRARMLARIGIRRTRPISSQTTPDD